MYMGNIIEQLFSVVQCVDTTGKGFGITILNVQSMIFFFGFPKIVLQIQQTVRPICKANTTFL